MKYLTGFDSCVDVVLILYMFSEKFLFFFSKTEGRR